MKKIIFIFSALIFVISASVSAHAEGEVLFQEDFDEYTWTNASKVNISDGWAEFDATSGGFTVEKNIDVAAENLTEISIEYKLRFEESIDNVDNSWTFPRVIGESAKDAEEEIYSAGIYVKRFLFYKNGGNIANYYFQPDLDYVIKANLNYSKNKFSVEIYEEGTEEAVQTHNLEPQAITDITTMKIKTVRFAVPKGAKVKVDYIKVLSTGLRLKEVTPSLANKVRTDSSLKLLFSDELDAATLSGIKVSDENGNAVVCDIIQDEEDKKLYEIYFPAGLLYDTSYKLSVSNEVKSISGKEFGAYEKEFITEALPFYIRSVLYYNENNKKIAADALSGVISLTNLILFSNNSGMEKQVTVLNLIYDENNRLLKLDNTVQTVEKGSNKYTISIDLADIENASYVKTYIWDSVEGMINIEQ